MNSLEFIKQHVTEWPSGEYHTVLLYSEGFAVFANSFEPVLRVQSIDLTEHFSPSYYDGKVWTREEFETCGKSTVDCGNSPDWDEAPSWVTSYGFAGLSKFPVWYNNNGYMIVDDPSQLYEFSRNTNFTINDITHHSHRPTPNTESSTGIDATVEERGNRYGAFKDGADIMQELKSVMRSTPNWSNLTPSQREALEMIQHKVGRILNGDPNYIDSWHDIKGYAHLIEEELNGNVK